MWCRRWDVSFPSAQDGCSHWIEKAPPWRFTNCARQKCSRWSRPDRNRTHQTNQWQRWPNEMAPLLQNGGLIVRHCRDQQAPVEEQVPHFAARLSDEEAAVACSAMGCPIAALVVRLVICTNRVIRADPQPLHGVAENPGESRCRRDQATKRSLSTSSGGIDQNTTAIDLARCA